MVAQYAIREDEQMSKDAVNPNEMTSFLYQGMLKCREAIKSFDLEGGTNWERNGRIERLKGCLISQTLDRAVNLPPFIN